MITTSGIYRVKVNEANNPTYLRGGVYHVEVIGKTGRQEANFRQAKAHNVLANNDPRRHWSGQSGTYERLNMLQGFEKQARVVCTPVSQDELDSVANSLFGQSFEELTEAQQIEACRAGVRA